MFNKERGNVAWISCLMLTITIWYSIRKDGDSHRAFIQKKKIIFLYERLDFRISKPSYS